MWHNLSYSAIVQNFISIASGIISLIEMTIDSKFYYCAAPKPTFSAVSALRRTHDILLHKSKFSAK